ncbi:hypothetical protein ACFLUY_01345 [Chloroflexota bacterium]
MTTESQQRMDAAADEAEQELEKIPNDVVLPVAQWFKRWYSQAGHKRLGRILVYIADPSKQPTNRKETQPRMAEAAKKAEPELENIPREVVMTMAKWYEKWYSPATHTRLGRTLVNIAKNARN